MSSAELVSPVEIRLWADVNTRFGEIKNPVPKTKPLVNHPMHV
jgi:hypothetical protein